MHFEQNEYGDDGFDIFVIFIAHIETQICKASCTRYAVRIQPRPASSETRRLSISYTYTGVKTQAYV